MLAERHTTHKDNGTGDILFDHSLLKRHVGYYLLGEGYKELARRIHYKMPLSERIRRQFEKAAGWYIGFIALHTLVLLAVLCLATGAVNHSLPVSVSVLLVALFPALELSVAAVNRIFAFTIPPRLLPKMKIREEIPDAVRTMVVVPTLVSSPEDVRRQLEKLEITSLANPDTGLQFVLLSDFTDADQEQMPGDEAILKEAEQVIGELNSKYSSRFGDKFFLLHRRRVWNPSDGVWMGWERKRGKLEKLNELLCNPEESLSFHPSPMHQDSGHQPESEPRD